MIGLFTKYLIKYQMQNITSSVELKAEILALEAESKKEWETIKCDLYKTCERITPLNILKYIFEDIIDTINIKEKIALIAMTIVKKVLHFIREKTSN